MSYRLIVDPGAESDIDFAYRWYEARSQDLGTRFLDEIEDCFDRVIVNPMSYPEVEAGIRRALPHAFPYLVFYTLEGDSLHVLAVIHAAQDPAYIAQRLGA
jgi:plasmid stabilization system protein ParE